MVLPQEVLDSLDPELREKYEKGEITAQDLLAGGLMDGDDEEGEFDFNDEEGEAQHEEDPDNEDKTE